VTEGSAVVSSAAEVVGRSYISGLLQRRQWIWTSKKIYRSEQVTALLTFARFRPTHPHVTWSPPPSTSPVSYRCPSSCRSYFCLAPRADLEPAELAPPDTPERDLVAPLALAVEEVHAPVALETVVADAVCQRRHGVRNVPGGDVSSG